MQKKTDSYVKTIQSMLDSIENSTVLIQKKRTARCLDGRTRENSKKYITCVCLYPSRRVKGFFVLQDPQILEDPPKGLFCNVLYFFQKKWSKISKNLATRSRRFQMFY